VEEAAQMLELQTLLERTPKQLSGGQRQRVAMGRAVVRRPRAFLFDEPLSNLDAALRGQMRVELMRLHRRLSATMIYVTHDQVEAMTLADRIAVLNGGVLQQVGPPDELYARPANLFVARFIGMPEMNVLPDGNGVRAEDVKLTDGDDAEVEVIEHLGWESLVHFKNGVVARVESKVAPRIGQRVGLRFENLHRFGSDGKRL
jgi:multiple sugar transport system ATP-binding protein